MKKIITLLTIVLLGVSNIFGNDAFDPVIAQVKLEKTKLIKLKEVNDGIKLLEAQYQRELTVEEKDFVLDQLINNELVFQAARRDGIQVTKKQIMDNFKAQNPGVSEEQIKKEISKQYGKSYEEVETVLIDTYSAQQYVQVVGGEDLKKAAPAPTEAEVIQFYEENSNNFINPDMVRVNHVFFKPKDATEAEDAAAKKRAEDALLEFKQGKKTFEELVQEISEDRFSAQNGGELGFITRNQQNHVQLLGKDFINQVFTLPMEDVHGVLKSNSGYHIIIITEKRSKRFLKINDQLDPAQPMTVAQYISQTLYQERANKAMAKITNDIIVGLREEAVIKIMDKAIPWKK